MAKKQLFDWLRDITQTKAEFDEEQESSYSPYMITRFVSMSNLHLNLANAINQVSNGNIPKKAHYNFYKSVFPKAFHRFNYIKSKKDKNNDRDFSIECISKYYEISPREALIYYNQLTDEQIKFITSKYEHGKIKRKVKWKKYLIRFLIKLIY